MPHNRGPRRDGWIRGLSDWVGLGRDPALVYLLGALKAPRDTYIAHRWRIFQDILEVKAHGSTKEVTPF